MNAAAVCICTLQLPPVVSCVGGRCLCCDTQPVARAASVVRRQVGRALPLPAQPERRLSVITQPPVPAGRHSIAG